ncbi:MAG: hypothetical protein EBU90_30820, partial [Proteobacteria bacterium]|nr:hypothetical protein [Pseudomonadota bacterium]
EAKVVQVQQVYYSPVAVVPPNIDIPLGTIYCFLSKVDPWDDENNPPLPASDQKSLKQVFKNIFAVKLIKTSDISPVIERIDWSSGIVYSYYRDDINMIEQDENGNLVNKFYVKNKYDQVFKCLWNNNGTPSTVEPYFEPGSYGTNNIFKGADNYKWKYIYTIDTGLKVKFMDKTWIPVTVGSNTPNPLLTSAGAGSIDAINVTNGGSGYDPANSFVTITVTGDGTGAVATANVVGGVIQDVIVVSPGSNYTYANVSITSTVGSNASAFAPTSPIGGHGFDPISELGCSHIMFTTEFNGSEGGVIPTDIDFHQVGLMVNPTTKELSPNPANGTIYRTTTDFIVAPGFGVYTADETVYQGTSLETATFTAKVLSFNTSTNVVNLINITGTP